MHSKIDQLFREASEQGLTRREMIQRAAVLGISPMALTVALVANSQQAAAQGTPAADGSPVAMGIENPLGIDTTAPLHVVIFDGGYGNDYAVANNERFNALYPDVEIQYEATVRLQEQYQASFVDGTHRTSWTTPAPATSATPRWSPKAS
jgi:N-acetylglucosamine transport system substrate-binding protein